MARGNILGREENGVTIFDEHVLGEEGYVQGNTSYGCFEVCILAPNSGEEDEPIASAGPLGGVEVDNDEYLLDTLNELFNEATHGLTL